MPWIEAAIAKVNTAANDAILKGGDARTQFAQFFDEDRSIADLFSDQQMGLNAQNRPLASFGQWPDAVWKAARSAIRSALEDSNVGSMTISWKAGYDYSVAVYQSTPFDGSPSGVTIQITTRYPFDTHPSLGGGNATA